MVAQQSGSSTNKRSMTLRLSDTGHDLATRLAVKYGASKTQIIEMAVRELAEQAGIEVPASLAIKAIEVEP